MTTGLSATFPLAGHHLTELSRREPSSLPCWRPSARFCFHPAAFDRSIVSTRPAAVDLFQPGWNTRWSNDKGLERHDTGPPQCRLVDRSGDSRG